MKAGIAPATLLGQVKNTASWLFELPEARLAAAILEDVATAEKTRSAMDAEAARYLRFLLAAHYATVATFVPTDVDARIRHHFWQAVSDPEALLAACAVVDEVAAFDPRVVSERVLDTKHGPVSGHDGEWFSVRAGALGRAVALGATSLEASLFEAIDAEVEREATILQDAFANEREPGGVERVLRAITIVAHNLGDLSRVAELLGPVALGRGAERFVRLGHADAPHAREVFTRAGILNKALMARENHRFLPLRKPRALRASRALLLPIGPWFDDWGERVARAPGLEERDHGEVVAALLDVHANDPEASGCLRALAGLHRSLRGGLDAIASELPARIRKDIARGPVREAIGIAREHFDARMRKRYELARARA